MKIYKPSEARANFFEIMEYVNDAHDEVIVKGKAKEMVMLSKQDHDALNETAYLLSSPENAKRLFLSMEQAAKGELFEVDLNDYL